MRFKFHHFSSLLVFLSLLAFSNFANGSNKRLGQINNSFEPDTNLDVDEFGRPFMILNGDTIHAAYIPRQLEGKNHKIDNDDYISVAQELGVEPAAIKAVVNIEAGPNHRGFYEEGKPIINFDLTVFRTMAAREKVNLSKYTKSHKVVFESPNVSKYGSRQKAQQARLDAAMSIDSVAAIYGTFWGMFQIGGFNWKKCGAESPQDFVAKMSSSEREQLEMFAQFIRSSGLLDALKRKDWSAFARGYNGPSYAKRGYHTKLQNAYNKFKKDF